MSDLRLIGKTREGTELELSDGAGKIYTLRIGDNLRALVNQPRIEVVAPPVATTTSLKEIQARLRGGESVAEIANSSDWPAEKIERFAGPILQERSHIIRTAHLTTMRRENSTKTFLEVAHLQLSHHGVDLDASEWNTWREDAQRWIIVLTFPNREGSVRAHFAFNPISRVITSEDENASWILGETTRERGKTPQYGLIPTESETTPPKLVSIRPEVVDIADGATPDHPTFLDSESRRDGITRKATLPSWDEIMFGSTESEDEK